MRSINHFIDKMQEDIKIRLISRTVDHKHVVDEVIISFIRDREYINELLWAIAPIAKYIEIPRVIIIKFIKAKICT